MAFEEVVQINNTDWTEVPLSAGSYYIEAMDPSVIIEYSLDSNGNDPFIINSGSSQYTLDNNTSLYFRAGSLLNGNTTDVYINDYSTKASAPLAAPQSNSIQITNQWTELPLSAGSYFLIPEAGNNIVSMSTMANNDISKALKRGGEQVSLQSPSSIYFKINTEDPNVTGLIKYNTINVIGSTGSGSGPTPGPTPGTSYTFNAPLSQSNGVVNLNFKNDLAVQSGSLTLNLNSNTDFSNLVARVNQNEQLLNTKANDNEVVKLTGNQSINGIKTFGNDIVLDANQRYNNNSFAITPSSNTNGVVQFFDNTIGAGCYSDIDMGSKGRIINIIDPQNDGDAVNKLYVDNAIDNNTLTFQGALQKVGTDVSIGLENDIVLNNTGDKLTLNLNANTDFRALLLKADENSRIATYTEIGRVMPKQNDFVMNGLTGELSLDLTGTGTLKQNFVDLSSQQIITGEKDFTAELRANNVVAEENGVGYGAVNINNQDGYFSITENGGQQATQLLAALGFVDSTTTLRIRNMAGGLVTFNTLVQYESTFTPTDDKDLVNLAYVRQVRQELVNIISQLQGFIHFIGVISNTSTEVTADPSLLTAFVQQEESRAPQNGDFVKTSDSYGFIFNGTNWINFGQVSITIATTTQAGIMMFGTNAGELEDIGFGKAKVIGWDTIETALRDLDNRTTTNTQNIQTANQSIATNAQNIQNNTTALGTKANDSEVVKLTGDQVINGAKSFRGIPTFPNKVKMGYGNNIALLIPEDDSTKTLRFRDTTIGSNNKFNLDLENTCGLTGIKDPASSRDAVPRDWANNKYLSKVSTEAVNTIQVTNSAQKYFNLDYVVSGTGYRNYSGIKLRAKQGTGSFEEMWTLTYRNSNDLGIFMTCIGNKLNFENPTKITNVSCEDSDGDGVAVSKIFLTNKLSALTGSYMDLTGDQEIGGVKNFTGTILSASSDRTYGSNRYYADNDASGLGQPVFNTYGTETEKQATIGFSDAAEQGKFEIKIENLPSRPNPKISLGNNTEIDGTLNVTGQITAPNMPVVLPAGTTPDTTNIPAMKVAYILK